MIVDVFLYVVPSDPGVADIRLSDPTVARSLRRRGWPLKPEPERVVAGALYDNLVRQYGLYEGRQVYFAMRREQKGPFAEGNKYETDGERAQRQVSTGIPVKLPEPDRLHDEFTRRT